MKRFAILATGLIVFGTGCCCHHRGWYGNGCDPCGGGSGAGYGAGYMGAPAYGGTGYMVTPGMATAYPTSSQAIAVGPAAVTASRPVDSLPTY